MFIDETWTKTNMAPLRGWTARGARLRAKVPHRRWKTMTFLAALRQDGVEAPWLLDGPINGESFRVYVENVLVPTLRPGDLVLRYGASEQDADNPLMLAIVVSVPEKKPLPGSDPTEFLRGIIVCGGDQGTGLVSMARFLGDPPSGGYSRGLPFQLRRLLKVK